MIYCRHYKEREEKRAHRNRCLLSGDHWWVWNKSAQRMTDDEDSQYWQAKLVYNLTLVIVEQRVSQLIRAKRVWGAIPENTDEMSRLAARLRENVMSFYWTDAMSMPSKLREALEWAMSSAVVFGIPFWNPHKGDLLTVTLDDFMQSVPVEQVVPPNAPPEIQLQAQRQIAEAQAGLFAQQFGQDALRAGQWQGREGDMDFEVAPIFEVGWYPFYPKRWSDVLIYSRTVKKPALVIADELGVPVDEVRKMAAGPTRLGWSMAGGSSRWADTYFDGDAAEYASGQDDNYFVTTLWRQPCGDYPEGAQAVVLGLGAKTVFLDKLQNASARAPVFALSEKPVRGQVLGTCLVDQLYHSQNNLNQAASQIADYRNKRIMPTLVTFTGDQGSKQQISNAPGKLYTCNNPDLLPRPIDMPDIGRDFFNTMDVDTRFMHDLGGVGSIDLGNADNSNVRSGRAIISLQEQNAARLIPFAERINEWVEDIGDFTDQEINVRVKRQRLLSIVGDNNELETVLFLGDGGKKNMSRKRIKVTAFSNIPKSPQEINNFVAMATSTQPPLLDPVKDRDTILQMMGYADYRALLDEKRTDKAIALDCIEKWKTGQPAGPSTTADDHLTQYRILAQWRKTEECKRIMAMNPKLAAEIEERILQHKRGVVEDQIETQYLARSADIRMWIQERQRWMSVGPAGAQIAQVFFPAPMSMMGPAAPVAGPTKSDESPAAESAENGTNQEPEEEGEQDEGTNGKRERDKKKKKASMNGQQRDKSQSQSQVQAEMQRS